jgi:hypothetical protein
LSRATFIGWLFLYCSHIYSLIAYLRVISQWGGEGKIPKVKDRYTGPSVGNIDFQI